MLREEPVSQLIKYILVLLMLLKYEVRTCENDVYVNICKFTEGANKKCQM